MQPVSTIWGGRGSEVAWRQREGQEQVVQFLLKRHCSRIHGTSMQERRVRGNMGGSAEARKPYCVCVRVETDAARRRGRAEQAAA